jgi:hypothetical protein
MLRTTTDDDCNDYSNKDGDEERAVNASSLSRHLLRLRQSFGDEWQQICETLLSCEQLLTVMSRDRPLNDDNRTTAVDTTDDHNRQQLRQIIRQIEPKKYSKSCRASGRRRRSSYHRLKALTQLLMTSNLKVSVVALSPVVSLSVCGSARRLSSRCLSCSRRPTSWTTRLRRFRDSDAVRESHDSTTRWTSRTTTTRATTTRSRSPTEADSLSCCRRRRPHNSCRRQPFRSS